MENRIKIGLVIGPLVRAEKDKTKKIRISNRVCYSALVVNVQLHLPVPIFQLMNVLMYKSNFKMWQWHTLYKRIFILFCTFLYSCWYSVYPKYPCICRTFLQEFQFKVHTQEQELTCYWYMHHEFSKETGLSKAYFKSIRLHKSLRSLGKWIPVFDSKIIELSIVYTETHSMDN